MLQAAVSQLRAWFAGELRDFELPMDPGGTPFQRRAWAALLDIPFGETRSYSAQAAALGDPKSVRAVATANARNPLPIVIPCHRVLGSDGALRGYAGGLDRKRWLLAHEARLVATSPPAADLVAPPLPLLLSRGPVS